MGADVYETHPPRPPAPVAKSSSQPQIKEPPRSAPRRQFLYQDWKGKNTFRCGGRLITGPDEWKSWGTACIILFPAIVYHAAVAPATYEAWTVYPTVVQAILTLVCIVVLFSGAYSDPGIVPRPRPPPLPKEKLKNVTAKNYVEIRGKRVLQVYCVTCDVWRPPRASHCKICQNCVDRWDHHCPWFGNCIGRRNYHTFILFLLVTPLTAVYTAAVCVTALADTNVELSKFSMGLAIIVTIYTAFALWPIGVLLTYHCRIISADKTTREDLKDINYGEGAADSEGVTHESSCVGNWVMALCEPTPPAINFRQSIALELSRSEREMMLVGKKGSSDLAGTASARSAPWPLSMPVAEQDYDSSPENTLEHTLENTLTVERAKLGKRRSFDSMTNTTDGETPTTARTLSGHGSQTHSSSMRSFSTDPSPPTTSHTYTRTVNVYSGAGVGGVGGGESSSEDVSVGVSVSAGSSGHARGRASLTISALNTLGNHKQNDSYADWVGRGTRPGGRARAYSNASSTYTITSQAFASPNINSSSRHVSPRTPPRSMPRTPTSPHSNSLENSLSPPVSPVSAEPKARFFAAVEEEAVAPLPATDVGGVGGVQTRPRSLSTVSIGWGRKRSDSVRSVAPQLSAWESDDECEAADG